MRAVGGARARGEHPETHRACCQKAARAQTNAPPLSKKKGGGRVPASLLGVPASIQAANGAPKKERRQIPQSSRHNGGVPAPRTNNKRGPRGENRRFWMFFSGPDAPNRAQHPPKGLFGKGLRSFLPPPPPRQRHPTVRKNLKRPPVQESGVFLWVGPFCWEGCAYTGPWLQIKVSIGWSPAGFGFFCRRETGNAGWGWGKCGGS